MGRVKACYSFKARGQILGVSLFFILYVVFLDIFLLVPQVTMKWFCSDQIIKEFFIPDYIMLHELNAEKQADDPVYPVIVFVNSKCGGKLGRELLYTYQTLLNKNQVIDLSVETPNKVLGQLYLHLKILKNEGDSLASIIESKLRSLFNVIFFFLLYILLLFVLFMKYVVFIRLQVMMKQLGGFLR